MREYGFVQSSQAIYRIFGQAHPRDKLLLLLRYYRLNTSWTKPPVYALETLAHPLLANYDIPVVVVPRYGMALGVASDSPAAYVQYYDPLRPKSMPNIIAEFEQTVQAEVGLSGSRLLGLHRPNSDLDIVLYGSAASDRGRLLLKTHATSIDRPIEPSVAFKRFLDTFHGDSLDTGDRNVFTGLADLGGEKLKLDISYSSTHRPVTGGTLSPSRLGEAQRFRGVRIEHDADRYYFPGTLGGTTANERPVRIAIRDHALHYVVKGDLLDLDARIVYTADSSTLTIVGTNLISTH